MGSEDKDTLETASARLVRNFAASMDTSQIVNKPHHYDFFPDMQALDIIQRALTPDEFRGYLKGNALKYRLRLGDKDDVQQDLAKSNAYRDVLRTGKRPDGVLLAWHPLGTHT